MISWLVLKLEISYRIMISWRILVSFRGIFWKIIFSHGERFGFSWFSFFCLKILSNVNGKVKVRYTPLCFQLFCFDWSYDILLLFCKAAFFGNQVLDCSGVWFTTKEPGVSERGTKAERNHSKAICTLTVSVHLSWQLCNPKDNTTFTWLLENCESFPTKSANPLTLHYQDKNTLMIYLWRKVVCLSWVQIFQTVQCLLLLLRFRWWWYH